jgi:hypothetical protein
MLYLDDLKLKDRNEEELTNEIQIVRRISNGIKMKFGLEKIAKISFKSVKVYRKQQMGKRGE